MSLRFDGRFDNCTKTLAPGDPAYSGPGLGGWHSVDASDPGHQNRLSYRTDIRRRPAGKIAWLEVGGDQGERIEFMRTAPALHDPAVKTPRIDEWHAWSVYMPGDSVSNSKIDVNQMFSKFVATICGTGGKNPSIRMVNDALDPARPVDKWAYTVSGGIGACASKGGVIAGLPIVYDEWVDFKMRAVWSDTTDGVQTLYWRRPNLGLGWTLGYDARGPNVVSSASFKGTVMLRHGLYRHKAIGSLGFTKLGLGGLVVADTEAEVEAAVFGDAPPPVEVDCSQVEAERDVAVARVAELEGQNATLTGERDAALLDLAGVTAERDAAVLTVDRVRDAWGVLRSELEVG